MKTYTIAAGVKVRFVTQEQETPWAVVEGCPGFFFTDRELVGPTDPLASHVGEEEIGFRLGAGYGKWSGGLLIVKHRDIEERRAPSVL